MKTITKENTWFPGMNHGWGNGYVIIPKGHKMHGVGYDDIPVDVHGGLTFSEHIDEELQKAWGLDESDIGNYIVGFDTAHYQDNLQRWPEESVQLETDRLKQQLEAIV